MARGIFQQQSSGHTVYARFLELAGKNPDHISWQSAPFLPISTFKHHAIKAYRFNAEMVFASSGTTGQQQSRHPIDSLSHYRQVYQRIFRNFYGEPAQYRILSLLPAYLERENSSLVHMANGLMKASGHPQNGFYLDDLEGLARQLAENPDNPPTLLLGVTFALLDLAEKFPMPLKNTIIMETGGMKGRRNEQTRAQVHKTLCKGFGVEKIHSEYGMAELLSQAYSQGNGRFRCPPWMKVLVRDLHDPFRRLGFGQVGALDIADLANYHSCAFIATDDLGRVYEDGTFEVMGRFDEAEARGCNLLYTG